MGQRLTAIASICAYDKSLKQPPGACVHMIKAESSRSMHMYMKQKPKATAQCIYTYNKSQKQPFKEMLDSWKKR
jgi:hypothetical protein